MMVKKVPVAAWIWGGATLLFLLFQVWHGAFSSPLSKAEVASVIRQLKAARPDITPKALKRIQTFLEKDDGKPVYMLNAIQLYKKPRPLPGVSSSATSSQVLRKYERFVMPYLIRRGGYPVLAGKASHSSLELWGLKKARKWTMGAVIRYPSRRVLAEMVVKPDFHKLHKFKQAAIQKTFAFPMEMMVLPGGVSLVVGLFLFALAAFSHLLLCLKRLHTLQKAASSA